MADTLAQSLLDAQREMPAILDDAKASTGTYQYSYVTLDHLLAKTLAVLHKHRLVLIQMPTHIDGAPALRTTLLHDGGEQFTDVMPLVLPKNDPQGQGAAITYARRYALSAALGISSERDDDGAGAMPRPDPNAFILAAVLKRFELYVADAKPWIKEATLKYYDEVTEFPGKWGDLPAKVREDLEPRLLVVLAFLDALKPEAVDMVVVRSAFANAFDGTVVDGPDPFQPPAPF